MNTTPSEFTDALARLDAEIAATEAHLAELRHKRTGAEAFLDYMHSGRRQQPPATAAVPATVMPTGSLAHTTPMRRVQPASAGHKDVVLPIFQPGVVVTLDDACAEAERGGFKLAREQIRNALHYLVRTQRIEAVGRAAWRLRDTEGPSRAGEEPSALSDLSPDEGGEHSNDETGHESHHHDLAGWNGDNRVGASIVGT